MKLRIDQAALAAATRWASRQLPTAPPIPVLAGLKITANNDGLTLEGFDYDTATRTTIPADVATPGAVLVSGRLLADITNSLPKGDVDLHADDRHLTVDCAGNRFTMLLLPLDEYPALPALPEATGAVDAETFAAAVEQVAPASDPKADGDMAVMTGIRVTIDGQRLTLHATDRYRVARRHLTWQPAVDDQTGTAVIPAHTLAATAKALADGGTIQLALPETGDGIAAIVGNRAAVTTRLLDPNRLTADRFNGLFPTEFAARARFDASELAGAVKRIALVADRGTPVRLRFDGAAEVVEVSAGTDDDAAGTSRVTAQLDSDEGEFLFAANPGYLLDGLAAIDGPAVLDLVKPAKPAVLHADVDDHQFTYLLMPVRLS